MISLNSIALALPETVNELARLGTLARRVQRPAKYPRHAGDRVAILEFAGHVDHENTSKVIADLAAASQNERIGEIVLLIDSGGGYAQAAFALAAAVREAAAVKPTHVHVGGTAASGAYLAASQATSIIAEEWAGIGSIGTYGVIVDTSEMLRRVGIHVKVVRAGRYKALTEPGIEVTPEALDEAKRMVDGINKLFLVSVARGRAISMKTLIDDIATGQVWLAGDALRLRLVDRIQPLSSFLADVLRRFPREEYLELYGEAAVDKYAELCGVSKGGIDAVDAATFAKVKNLYPTLTTNALAYKRPTAPRFPRAGGRV